MNNSRKQEGSDEQLFREEISKILYPQGNYKIEKDCFEVFYNKENEGKSTENFRRLLNKKKSINESISSTTRVSQLRTDITKKIKQTFEGEMKADIQERIELIPGRRGHPEKGNAPHEVASDWLWNYKYPRWLVDRGLQSLIAGADQSSEWIDFFKSIDIDIDIDSSNRGLQGNPRPQPSQPTIDLNKSYLMSIKLPKSEGYFLLLNRGFFTRLFLCPSQDYAPNTKIDKEEMSIPQEDAQCRDIFFDEIGKEEFIGIWVNKDLKLPWGQEESSPECTPERINHLLAELKASQCQVFYKSFNVVS